MKLSKFTIEVMGHLSPVEWKSGNEIAKEVGDEWKKQGRRKYLTVFISLFSPDFAEEIAQRPSTGRLYVAFAELESNGLTEERWRVEPPEVTARRNGHRIRERKLTEKGHRIRALQPKTSDELGKDLVPKHA